jgi:hypothetical protein
MFAYVCCYGSSGGLKLRHDLATRGGRNVELVKNFRFHRRAKAGGMVVFLSKDAGQRRGRLASVKCK